MKGNRMRRFVPLLLLTAVALPLQAATPSNLDTVIAHAVADPVRPVDSEAADALRLPAQTLVFSGVRPA